MINILLRPGIWIMLTLALIGFLIAEYVGLNIEIGLVIGLLVGFLIMLRFKFL